MEDILAGLTLAFCSAFLLTKSSSLLTKKLKLCFQGNGEQIEIFFPNSSIKPQLIYHPIGHIDFIFYFGHIRFPHNFTINN